ncbi:hypothetical protein BT69DRAFT_1333341 [Atractiella rhizophila]|nr:hypothetical protein BT69DRAFT_1333341 [Atractiella rhizophila]
MSSDATAAPLFKRKSAPTRSLKRPRPRSPSPASGAASGGASNGGGGVEEILLRRKLAKLVGGAKRGIDVEVLNAGEEKADEKEEGMEDVKGGLTRMRRDKDRVKDWEGMDLDEAAAKVRRSVKSNNFTQQTNALDVDKHLGAAQTESAPHGCSWGCVSGKEEQGSGGKNGKKDELYEIQESWKVEKFKAQEGTVSGSLGMLTNIPEVDLGIDNRLKTISETEIAKRALFDSRSQSKSTSASTSKGLSLTSTDLEILSASVPSSSSHRFPALTPLPTTGQEEDSSTWRAQRFYVPPEDERHDLDLDFDPVEFERERVVEEGRRRMERERKLREAVG